MSTEKLEKAASALLKARAQIAKAEAKIKPLKDVADALEDEIRIALIDAKLESFGTKDATFSLRHTTFAELYDDAAFFEYVRRQRAFDLVRKQPVIAACKARWDEKIDVPGVRPAQRVDLSITKKR